LEKIRSDYSGALEKAAPRIITLGELSDLDLSPYNLIMVDCATFINNSTREKIEELCAPISMAKDKFCLLWMQ
jgi:hypothetical protein